MIGTKENLVILIPKTRSELKTGSGIVGFKNDSGEFACIYFEGNVYGAENLMLWADRVVCAAGRAIQKYPTVARQFVPIEEFENKFQIVGQMEGLSILDYTVDRAAVAAYCNTTELGL